MSEKGPRQFVAFSGGVDSTALALLMPEATPIFTDTGWEFDHLYKHIEKFERVTGREVVKIKWERFPNGIPEYIERMHFLPSHGARWCTVKFKILPMNRYLKKRRPAVLNIALRADEDVRPGNLTEMKGLEIAYPLQKMGKTRADVVEIGLENGLIQRYPPYAARGGCKGCFYKRKSELIAMKVLVPEVLDELRELEEGVQDARGKFFNMFPNVGKSVRVIQAQQTLFDMEAVYAAAADTSDYGENCGLFCNR